jgi:hypothetical protein
MKRVVGVGLGVLAACALLVPLAPAAQAAIGEVAVFSSELLPLKVYENPRQCNPLPVGAHVLVNLTNRTIVIHGDPWCLTPGLEVKEGYGSHVTPAAGSFSA